MSFYYTSVGKFSLSEFTFPKAFIVSTVLILFSSVFFFKARENFEASRLHSVRRYLLIVLTISLVFMILQVLGWKQLIGYSIMSSQVAAHSLVSFIYMLSGLHFIHLAFGAFFLLRMLWSVQKASHSEISAMVFLTEPYTKARLATLSLFWVYLEVVWALQFLVFYLIYW